MNRITKKRKGYGYELASDQEIYAEENGIRLVQVVGEYEDLKEKLGCDPMIVMKAMTDGCWIRDGYLGTCDPKSKPQPIDASLVRIGFVNYAEYGSEVAYGECLCIFDMDYEDIDHCARLSDYGRTWALTKEELL